jgi:acetyl esterase/lipase
VLIVLGLAYHFAALRIFNALVPKDDARLVGRDFIYGSHPRHRFDFYAPPGDGPHPVLLFVYGGSWDSGDKAGYEFVGRAFASRGYVTAIMDYRLVPEVFYPAFVEDVGLALPEVLKTAKQHGGDPDRLFLAGHSAGAYNIVQAILKPGFIPPEIKISAVATLAGPFDFVPLDSPKSIAAFSHFAPLEDTQPVHHARGDAPPMLLLHGADDTTVRVKNSRNLAAKLSEKGAAVEFKLYQGVSHVGILLALAKPLRGRAPVFEDVLAFFDRYK